MQEELYTIDLMDNGETLVVLTDRRCLSRSMECMETFITQIKVILKNDKDKTILRTLKDRSSCKHIVRLSFNNMTCTNMEYSLMDISKIDIDSYKKDGRMCITDKDGNSYCTSKYNNVKYCLFR